MFFMLYQDKNATYCKKIWSVPFITNTTVIYESQIKLKW